MNFVAGEDTVSATDEGSAIRKHTNPFADDSGNTYLHFVDASSSTRYEKGSGRAGLCSGPR